MRTVSTSMALFIQLTLARRTEILNARHNETLLSAVEQLRTTAPLLVVALRTFILNPANLQAQAR